MPDNIQPPEANHHYAGSNNGHRRSAQHSAFWLALGIAFISSPGAQSAGLEIQCLALTGVYIASAGDKVLAGTFEVPATGKRGILAVESGIEGLLVLEQLELSPEITVGFDAGKLVVQWKDPSGTYRLEQADGVTAGTWDWRPVESAATRAGDSLEIHLTGPSKTCFFRLVRH